MPPNRFESEVESFLEGSHGDRTHIKRADHPRLHHYAGRYLQNSPSTSKNADFGPFSACWAKIFTLTAQPTDAGRILSRTGHVNTSSLKDKSPLREVLGAIVKHFSPMRVHKSQFWPFSTEQGRCFFHRRLMPGTRAIRWGDIWLFIIEGVVGV